MKIKMALLTGLAATAILASQSTAATFTNVDLFAAQGDIAFTETFDDDIAEAQMITFASGITSTTTR